MAMDDIIIGHGLLIEIFLFKGKANHILEFI